MAPLAGTPLNVPELLLALNSTVNCPPKLFTYVCEGFSCVLEFPSPKSQKKVSAVPVYALVKLTVKGLGPAL